MLFDLCNLISKAISQGCHSENIKKAEILCELKFDIFQKIYAIFFLLLFQFNIKIIAKSLYL